MAQSPDVSPQDASQSQAEKDILHDADFLDLTRRKNSISIVLTVATLLIYFGFIFLLAFGRDVLATPVSRGVTLGIPLGIGVIFLSWIFTGIYMRWANSKYDDMVARVKTKLKN